MLISVRILLKQLDLIVNYYLSEKLFFRSFSRVLFSHLASFYVALHVAVQNLIHGRLSDVSVCGTRS